MTADAIRPPTVPNAAGACDVVTPGLAARFLAALGRDPGDLREGDPAPPGLHWCLAPEVPRAGEIGPDGIAEGGIIPTLDLPRRVWGGSTITVSVPLRIGDRVTRRSRVLGIDRTSGRSGALAFARIEHGFAVEGRTCLQEVQTIVYREAATGEHAVPPPSRPSGRVLRRVTPDFAMLFRFSAITFNAHRIHYDLPYTRDVEGYPGLLVHGPLTAALLLDAAHRDGDADAIGAVSFRAIAPAISGTELTLVAESEAVSAWAEGRLVMTARSTPA